MSSSHKSSKKLSSVTHVKDLGTLTAILSENVDQPVFIKFTATWCGPCKMIAPYFEALAIQYSHQAKFLSVDVDECSNIAQQYRISAMPTFLVIRNNQQINSLRGADQDKLEAMVQKHTNHTNQINIRAPTRLKHNASESQSDSDTTSESESD